MEDRTYTYTTGSSVNPTETIITTTTSPSVNTVLPTTSTVLPSSGYSSGLSSSTGYSSGLGAYGPGASIAPATSVIGESLMPTSPGAGYGTGAGFGNTGTGLGAAGSGFGAAGASLTGTGAAFGSAAGVNNPSVYGTIAPLSGPAPGALGRASQTVGGNYGTDAVVGTSGLAPGMFPPSSSLGAAPLASGLTSPTGIPPAAAGTTAHKGGFLSNLFHRHGTTAGAVTHDPTTEQADRFIDNLAKHPKELSYYEQFVVQYNRGMRFSPTQAQRLVEVLSKNASARGGTVPYYSVYALELLLKLSIADPLIHSQMSTLDDTSLSHLGLGRYIAHDETKILGLNFMLYLHRILGRPNYQSWLTSTKGNEATMWQSEFTNYLGTQQNIDMAMFLEGVSRRLPPLLPHAGYAGEQQMLSKPMMMTTQVPVTYTQQVVTETLPVATSTVTEVIREVPVSTQTVGNTTTTVYRPSI